MRKTFEVLKSLDKIRYLLLLIFIFFYSFATSQVVVNGNIYEAGTQTPLEGVSVANRTTQRGELTDRYGYFSVDGKVGDSIEIRLLGYFPKTFAVPEGKKIVIQNIYLTIRKFQLQQVQIMARPDFKRDSLLNREENAAIFNYKKPNVINGILTTAFHPLSGLDNLLHAKQRQRMRSFQDRLETQEQERYIDSRYSRQLVSNLTSLQGSELETFMKLYRPTFEYLQTASDYDLFSKIKEDYKDYSLYKSSQPDPKS